LFGNSKVAGYLYKFIFCVFVFIGSIMELGAVLDFSDLMILGMAFPNIIGLIIMSKEVKEDLASYLSRVKSDESTSYSQFCSDTLWYFM
jgi:AGCS family alanine or glycine:cation symporter